MADSNPMEELKKRMQAGKETNLDGAAQTVTVDKTQAETTEATAENTADTTADTTAQTTTTEFSKEETAPAAPRAPRQPKEKQTFSKLIGELVDASKVKKNAIKLGSPFQKLLELMSEKSTINGFIKPNDSRLDIVVSRDKSQTYNIDLKEKMSRTIRGIIYRYPAQIAEDIARLRLNADEVELNVVDKYRELFEINPHSIPFNTAISTVNDFINWMTKFCWGRIQEAPEIYWVHKKYTKSEASPTGYEVTEITSPDKSGNEYTLYPKITKLLANKAKGMYREKLPQLTDLYAIKSSYRGTTLAVEGNYIAIEKYQTIRIPRTISAEDAKRYNRLYVQPAFGSSEEVYSKKISNMSQDALQKVTKTVPENFQSAFFSESGSILADKNYVEKIPRYFDKKQTLTLSDVKLVRKDWNKRGTNVEYKKIAFGSEGNTLSNPEYAKIVKSCHGTLEETKVMDFIDSLKKSKGGSKSGRSKDSLFIDIQPTGDDLLRALIGM